MTRLTNPSRVNGSIHQLSTLQSLSSDRCNVLFVSDQVQYLLDNLAEKDVTFLGRYATEYLNASQAFVVTPGDPEVEFIDRLIEDFQLQVRGDDVEIATALNNIAMAIAAQVQCCDGPTSTGTGGASGQETTPSDGVDNGVVPPTTTSFPTYGEYETYKCNVANFVVDRADSTANSLQTVAWDSILTLPAAEIIVILAATFATPIPGDEIIALASILALWGGAFTPVFDNLEDAIDNHRQDLVCSLFDAGDVETAKANFQAALDTAIDAESTPGGLLNTVTKGVSRIFVNTDGLNALFTEDDSRTYPTGSVDCSLCGAVVSIKFTLGGDGVTPRGTGDLSADNSNRQLSSVLDTTNGNYYIAFGVYEAPSTANYATNCTALPAGVSGTSKESFDFTFTALIRNPNSGTLGTICNSGSHGVAYNSSVVQGQLYDITWCEWISTNPFTLDVTLNNPDLP